MKIKLNKIRLLIIGILLTIFGTITWYVTHLYSAGLVDQISLVEFGMEDDFLYCTSWRSDLYDTEKVIQSNGREYLPISWASKYKHNKIFRKLLIIDDVDRKNAYGRSALHNLAYNSNLDNLVLLIDSGADLESKGSFGWTPFLIACNSNNSENIEIIRELLNRGAEINVVNNENSNGLHLAILKRNFKIANLLIKNGIDINYVNKNGVSPILMCGAVDDVKLLQFLIENNASMNDKNSFDNSTILHLAVRYNNYNIIKFIRDKYSFLLDSKDRFDQLPIHFSATQDNLETLKLSLSKENINSIDKQDRTPLRMACGYNIVSNVDFLIKNGADVNFVDVNGDTPLHIAAVDNNLEIINLLLSAGADKSLRNKKSELAYDLATEEKIQKELKEESQN